MALASLHNTYCLYNFLVTMSLLLTKEAKNITSSGPSNVVIVYTLTKDAITETYVDIIIFHHIVY